MSGDGLTDVGIAFDAELGAWILDGGDDGPAGSVVCELGEIDWHVDWRRPGRLVLAIVPTDDGTSATLPTPGSIALVDRLCGAGVVAAITTTPAPEPGAVAAVVPLADDRRRARHAAGLLAVAAEYRADSGAATWWAVAATLAAHDLGINASEIAGSDDADEAGRSLATLTAEMLRLVESRSPEVATTVRRAGRFLEQLTGRPGPESLRLTDAEVDRIAADLLIDITAAEHVGAGYRNESDHSSTRLDAPVRSSRHGASGSGDADADAEVEIEIETSIGLIGVDTVRQVRSSSIQQVISVTVELGSRPPASLVAVLADAATGARLEAVELSPAPGLASTLTATFTPQVAAPESVEVVVTSDDEVVASDRQRRRASTARHHARAATHLHRIAAATAAASRPTRARAIAADARRRWDLAAEQWDLADDPERAAAARAAATSSTRIVGQSPDDPSNDPDVDSVWVVELAGSVDDLVELTVEDALDLHDHESAASLATLLPRCEALERWADVVVLQDRYAAALEAAGSWQSAFAMNELAGEYAWRCADPAVTARVIDRRARLRARHDAP